MLTGTNAIASARRRFPFSIVLPELVEFVDGRCLRLCRRPVSPEIFVRFGYVRFMMDIGLKPAGQNTVRIFEAVFVYQIKAFKSNEETSQLLFIIEQYIGKPLS